MFFATRIAQVATVWPAGWLVAGSQRSCGKPSLPRPRIKVSVSAGGGGGSSSSSSGSKGFGGDTQSKVKEARETQLQATDMLAKLLQAQDPKAVAKQHLSSLTEQFFQIGGAYMQMAQKEGNTEVFNQVKAALAAAMEVKQSTLRPEIQLLNRLLAAEDALSMKQILNSKQAGEQLTMNDGYFFQLLERMAQDVGRQPDNPQKAELQQKLAGIKQVAMARLPPKQ